MKKLSTLLIESIVNELDKKAALYILQELKKNKWDELSEEEQKTLVDAIEKLKANKK